jgi:hypothetical protein
MIIMCYIKTSSNWYENFIIFLYKFGFNTKILGKKFIIFIKNYGLSVNGIDDYHR